MDVSGKGIFFSGDWNNNRGVAIPVTTYKSWIILNVIISLATINNKEINFFNCPSLIEARKFSFLLGEDWAFSFARWKFIWIIQSMLEGSWQMEAIMLILYIFLLLSLYSWDSYRRLTTIIVGSGTWESVLVDWHGDLSCNICNDGIRWPKVVVNYIEQKNTARGIFTIYDCALWRRHVLMRIFWACF